jgi:glycosyltransferase involved in cell wall biosynthesis
MSLDREAGGGAVNRIVELSLFLAKKKHSCTILTTKKNLKYEDKFFFKKKNIHIVDLKYFSERYIFPIKIFKWLKKNARSFDVIHLSLNWSLITALSYLYLRFQSIPFYFSAMGWLKIKGSSKYLKFLYRKFITIPMIKNAKICFAITHQEFQEYLKFGAKKKKLSLISNGVNVNLFSKKVKKNLFRKKYKIDNRPIILFIGRIDPIKGPDILIKAFARVIKVHKNYQLVICGNDNNYLHKLIKLTNDLELCDKVTFLGPVIGDTKISAYKSSSLMVVPSRFDTMTIVALESGAAGLETLISNNANFPKTPNNNGFYFFKNDPKYLAKKIIKILNKKKLLTTHNKKMVNYIKKRFSWDIIGSQFLKKFKEL